MKEIRKEVKRTRIAALKEIRGTMSAMNVHGLVIGLSVGSVLLAAGLVPGLFDNLAEAAIAGLRNFRDALDGLPAAPQRARYRRRRPVVLAGAGALLMAVTFISWLL